MLDFSAVASLPFFTLSLSFISLFFFFFLFFFHSSHSNKTPCPQSYPIIGNLIGLLRNHHRFHDWVADMLSQTPSLTLQVNGFLTTRGVCTANPRNVDHLLAANFPNYVKGSRYTDNLHDFLGDGIFNADGEIWTSQRKIASHEFNTKSLKHFISDTVQSELSGRLIPYLSATCDGDKVIDLQDTFRRFSFDNICNVAFGVDPACLDEAAKNSPTSSNHSAFVKAFDDAVEISSSRFMSPVPAIWKIKRILDVGSEKRFREAVQIIDDYAMAIIRNKEEEQAKTKEKASQNQDLLSRFMNSNSNLEFQDQEHKRKFLRDIVKSFILAGKDSTSTALTWFFWLISGNPRCERLIYAELSSVAPVTERRPGIFSYDELKKFNYLHAALSESMRLFPPVPINSRLTVTDDELPDGTHVRKGWFADYSAYAMGRMEKLWGPDCREFKPERWLDEEGVFRPSDQFKYPVFHSGPRICLGKEMAYVQMKSVVAAVMHEFEVVAVDGGGCAERMMDPPYTLSLLLKMRGGLPVRVKRRH
ncbi:hypothetical protein L1049_018699 [Liquidambar formosana]|uniref:Cytochrome P450 n=1 Tax=Liquidambar formosana TaxID=63359 RepID=A0AAP0RBD0_LIQFO